jgi:hypothetical protein
LNLTQDTIWNTVRTREMDRSLTPAEARSVQVGQSKEEIVKERFWRMRPDGIAVLPPVGNKTGVFCILEHKCMSDVCDRYLTRVKLTGENQYVSLRRAISDTVQCQGWKVEQIRFITFSEQTGPQQEHEVLQRTRNLGKLTFSPCIRNWQ